MAAKQFSWAAAFSVATFMGMTYSDCKLSVETGTYYYPLLILTVTFISLRNNVDFLKLPFQPVIVMAVIACAIMVSTLLRPLRPLVLGLLMASNAIADFSPDVVGSEPLIPMTILCGFSLGYHYHDTFKLSQVLLMITTCVQIRFSLSQILVAQAEIKKEWAHSQYTKTELLYLRKLRMMEEKDLLDEQYICFKKLESSL